MQEWTVKTMESNFFKFMKAAINTLPLKEAKSEWGKVIEFQCPVCGGNAKTVRSKENGHLRAVCEKCGMKIIE